MISVKANTKTKGNEHLVVITDKFRNEFGLPGDIQNYLSKSMEDKDKKFFSYNHLGRLVIILRTNKERSENQQREDLRRHGHAVHELIAQVKGATVSIHNQVAEIIYGLDLAEGIFLSAYKFTLYKTKKSTQGLQEIVIADPRVKKLQADRLEIVCKATCMARDLVNEPVNVLNAPALAKAFKNMGEEAGFSVEVLNKKKITELRMGGLLAVNAGSVDEPTFTIMEYKPRGAKNKKPYVLVGKGVVYDTGGLSLKPTPNSMDAMKCDMAGAAAVGAALYAVAKAKIAVHVIGLVPATDNRPGFNAFAPGDIITMMNGSTVEMLNSDAEGRMILADALHYAKRFKPELTIDIATLTGAASAAIGPYGIVGMGTAGNGKVEKLKIGGEQVHERIAEFPFWEEYDELMKSDIADQKNIGGQYAGAITAGKFLAKFTDYPYYHLDIAGPAFLNAGDAYRPKGGTGVGVRLFFEFFKMVAGEK